jgi:acyl-CoA thioesterase
MDKGRRMFERIFENDHFIDHVGVEFVALSPGRARVKFEIKKNHLNGLGSVHGGMLFTLADIAYGAASNSRGRLALLLNASMSFIKPARGAVIFAEAEEVSRSGRHAVYSVSVTDDSGDTVASFQGMAYVKDKTWDFEAE